jgi:hypothetical protein
VRYEVNIVIGSDYPAVAADEILKRLEEKTLNVLLQVEIQRDSHSQESVKFETTHITPHPHELTKLNPYPEYTCDLCKITRNGLRFHCALCQYDCCDDCSVAHKESIETDAFLSHKRTTAQVIAGRLYEGLKNDYKIFLDSEAKFKVHDLELIVANTRLFILILSSGYLER